MYSGLEYEPEAIFSSLARTTFLVLIVGDGVELVRIYCGVESGVFLEKEGIPVDYVEVSRESHTLGYPQLKPVLS
jgi:hypothetical protein